MSMLDYTVEPEVECLDSDVNAATFVRVTTTIRVTMLSKNSLLVECTLLHPASVSGM
jgi:hypothetical protein